MNPSYDAWNRALTEHFFRPDCAGRPVYLSVDDEELEELASDVGVEGHQAVESLARAVRAEFTSSSSYGLYARFFRVTREWRKEGVDEEPPPFIALHALAVLAGSRMARDPSSGIASHNYYARYNELIGRDVGEGRPPGFEELGRLWEDLRGWLEHDCAGKLGRSTIRRHPRLAHIGYPVSQCLLRDADRRRLTEFFRAVGLEPGDEITTGELFSYLQNWARPGCGLSAPALRIIADAPAEVAEETAEIIKREFDSWRGEILDEHGRRRADIALVLEVAQGGHRIAAWLWPRCPDGFPPELKTRLPNGQETRLRTLLDGWYEPLPIEISRRVLEGGVTTESDGYSLTYNPSRVIPLRASEELGRWVSVRQLRAVEPHCVVMHVSAAEDVRNFLRTHAEPEWRPLPETGALPAGWKVLDRVQVTSPATPAQDHLAPLAPRFGTSTSFEGGLEITRSQYLVGGEPDLWVTVDERGEAQLEIDSETVQLGGGVVRFRLSEMDLPAGDHYVRVGGLTRRFSTFAGFETAAPSGTGTLGHALRRGHGYSPEAAGAEPLPHAERPRGTVYVCGASARADPADLPEPLAPPILLPAGFHRYVVLGCAPGEVVETSDPHGPTWLSKIGLGGQYQFFDQPLRFEAQWVILEGRADTQVRPLREPPVPPAARATGTPEDTERWCESVLHAASINVRCRPEYEDAWERYVHRAREVSVAG